MANPRKFSEKIALHNQKQAEETAAFEKIMREVSDATNKVNSSSRCSRAKALVESEDNDSTLRPGHPGLGTFRSGSLPNVAGPQDGQGEPEKKPEDNCLASQYGMGSGSSGGRSGGTSPSRGPGPRGRASSSVGPMRNRPAERKHDTSPYGSTVYLSPPPDSSWRRTNSDSALHQSCNEQPPSPSLSPHHPLHSHAHPHHNHHHHHRRATDIHMDVMATMGATQNSRPRSSCEMPRIPNNTNMYEMDSGGGGGVAGGGGLQCGELQVPGGSLPDLTSVHYPHPQQHAHQHPHHMQQRASPPNYPHQQSPSSPGAISPGGGSISPATGGVSPASGSPVGATVPTPLTPLDPSLLHHDSPHSLYDTQNHLSVPNSNSYLHHSKNMSPLDHTWMTSSYQSHCSPPSQYSSTSNINIPSPTMLHSPGSPAGSPQSDYSNLHQALLQPFEQITMDWAQLVQSLVESGWTVADNLDHSPNYNSPYMNHSSPVSPQPTSSPHSYTQAASSLGTSPVVGGGGVSQCRSRDPVPGGAVFPARLTSPASIPDIILTDYSGELDGGMFGEEAQLRAGLDLDELTLLEEPSSLLPDQAVEHEFRLDRL